MKRNPTKPYVINRTGKYTKMQRKWMRHTGEWFLRGKPGYKITLEDLRFEAAKIEHARVEKAKELLDFKEETVEG